MSEKPGFNPEIETKNTAEKLELSDDQKTEVDKYVERLFGAYFSRIKVDVITEANQKTKANLFKELVVALDKGFNFFTQKEKGYLLEQIAEKIKLEATPEEDEKKHDSEEEESSTPEKPRVRELKDINPDKNPREVFAAILKDAGITDDPAVFQDIFSKYVNKVVQSRIKTDELLDNVLVTDFEKKGDHYVFFSKLIYHSNKKKSLIKCDLTFDYIKRGIPGKQKIEKIPKWFMVSVSKYV
jgi:hypothetical protein